MTAAPLTISASSIFPGCITGETWCRHTLRPLNSCDGRTACCGNDSSTNRSKSAHSRLRKTRQSQPPRRIVTREQSPLAAAKRTYIHEGRTAGTGRSPSLPSTTAASASSLHNSVSGFVIITCACDLLVYGAVADDVSYPCFSQGGGYLPAVLLDKTDHLGPHSVARPLKLIQSKLQS